MAQNLSASPQELLPTQVTGTSGRSKPKRSRAQQDAMLGYLLILPSVVILVIVLVYPTIFNLLVSVRQWSWSASAAAPKPFVGFDNFMALFRMARFWNAIRVSLLMVFFGLIVQYVLGLGLALLLNEQVKGQRIFRTIFLLPMILAPIVVGIQWRYLLSGNFGVVNYLLTRLGTTPPSWLSDPHLTLWVIILVDTWMYLPFVALILLAGLQQIPKEVYEAAEVDGANSWAKFRNITLPALGPATITVLLMRGTEIFRAFDVVYVMTGGGPGRSTENLGMMLYKTAFSEGNMGTAAALAIIIGVIGMAIGMFFIRMVRTDKSML
jgi:multiple sugar transport system permease protein